MTACRQLSIFGSLLLSLWLGPAHAGSSHDWQHVSPAEAGFMPDIGKKLEEAARTNEFANLHAVVVVRDGKLVLESYFEGADERRGRPLGTVKFGPKVMHDLRSVTKSIVGLLYGIALADGKVPGPNQPLVSQFPAYVDLAADPKRKRMTISHALSMTLGTDWNEGLPYTDPRNSETAMDMAADRYRYVLEQRFLAAPGSQWNYNGGATALLAHLISQGTGQPLIDYARQKLFEPLGIDYTDWVVDSNGEPIAASGLRMRPRDLAKIGQMILDRGSWNNAQVVPAAWLDQSFAPKVRVDDNIEYGYHWWLGRLRSNDQPWVGALGNGGQRLYILPSAQLVVVITAGNYNKPDQRKLPIAVMSKVVMPALRDR